MAISGIGTTSTTPPPATTSRGFNDMKSEDFFGLLIAQLQAQDPMKPTSNQELLQQISTIRGIEQSSTLNSTLNSLAGEQRFGATSGLIGHYVAGTVTSQSGATKELQGLVIGVSFQKNGKALLELHNGQQLPAEDVEQVTLVENLPPEILAQLEQELGHPATGGDDPGEGPTGTNTGAKLIASANEKSKRATVLDALLHRNDEAKVAAKKDKNTVSALLNSFFSPGAGVSAGFAL